MRETITFILTGNTVLSIQSRECDTLTECIDDIDPALTVIKDLLHSEPHGFIKRLTEIAE